MIKKIAVWIKHANNILNSKVSNHDLKKVKLNYENNIIIVFKPGLNRFTQFENEYIYFENRFWAKYT